MSNRIYKLFAVGALPLVLHGCGGCGDEEPAVNSNSTNTTKPPAGETNTNSSTPATPPATVKPAVSLDDLINQEYPTQEKKDEILAFYQSLVKAKVIDYKTGSTDEMFPLSSGEKDLAALTIFTVDANAEAAFPAPFDDLFTQEDWNKFQPDKDSRPQLSDLNKLVEDVYSHNQLYVTEGSNGATMVIYNGSSQVAGESDEEYAKRTGGKEKPGLKNDEKKKSDALSMATSIILLDTEHRLEVQGDLRPWLGIAALENNNPRAVFTEMRAIVRSAIMMKVEFDEYTGRDFSRSLESKEYQKAKEADKLGKNPLPYSRWREYDSKEGMIDGVGADAPLSLMTQKRIEEENPNSEFAPTQVQDAHIRKAYKNFVDKADKFLEQFHVHRQSDMHGFDIKAAAYQWFTQRHGEEINMRRIHQQLQELKANESTRDRRERQARNDLEAAKVRAQQSRSSFAQKASVVESENAAGERSWRAADAPAAAQTGSELELGNAAGQHPADQNSQEAIAEAAAAAHTPFFNSLRSRHAAAQIGLECELEILETALRSILREPSLMQEFEESIGTFNDWDLQKNLMAQDSDKKTMREQKQELARYVIFTVFVGMVEEDKPTCLVAAKKSFSNLQIALNELMVYGNLHVNLEAHDPNSIIVMDWITQTKLPRTLKEWNDKNNEEIQQKDDRLTLVEASSRGVAHKSIDVIQINAAHRDDGMCGSYILGATVGVQDVVQSKVFKYFLAAKPKSDLRKTHKYKDSDHCVDVDIEQSDLKENLKEGKQGILPQIVFFSFTDKSDANLESKSFKAAAKTLVSKLEKQKTEAPLRGGF